MPKIIVFSENELEIIEELKTTLAKLNSTRELQAISSQEIGLKELASSISKYPSILREQHLSTHARSFETLINNLCVKEITDIVFHIPTKAILGQGFSIAKINFFFQIYYLYKSLHKSEEDKNRILELISHIVFTILVEEVFLGIISDKAIPIHIRTNAGYFLVNIWEYRIDYGVKEFAPILNNVWRAKKNQTPSFGTMMGITELFRICGTNNPILLEFLERNELNQEEIDSLYEFLMGLSYEEMEQLRKKMVSIKKFSLSMEEVEKFIDKSIYPEYESKDPRELYRSFRDRKNHAIFREKSKTQGPKKTMEEYIMCYLLTRPEQWINI